MCKERKGELQAAVRENSSSNRNSLIDFGRLEWEQKVQSERLMNETMKQNFDVGLLKVFRKQQWFHFLSFYNTVSIVLLINQKNQTVKMSAILVQCVGEPTQEVKKTVN